MVQNSQENVTWMKALGKYFGKDSIQGKLWKYIFDPVLSDMPGNKANWWKTFYSSFPEKHGIDAIWTGVQRFNATHFSERVSMTWSYVDE